MSGERHGWRKRRTEPPGSGKDLAHRTETLPLVVHLYSADDCSLCRVALADLAPLAKELGLLVRVVDITGDPRLEARYRSRIPVAEICGRAVFKYRVDEVRLRKMVARARGLTSEPGGPLATTT